MIDSALLLAAYAEGIFPMADPDDNSIRWYSPDPRTIIDVKSFNVPRSVRHQMKQKKFEFRFDTRFNDVIRGCAGREETWISEEIIESYVQLHDLGYAHSVEAWNKGALAGGLYGVALGGVFFGESMFSRIPGASKGALVVLGEHLKEREFDLLDVQFMTEHLKMFGAVEISRDEYMFRLQKAVHLERSFFS